MKQFDASLLHAKLKEYFGFSSFKGNQEAVIRNVLERKDTFVLMPTGGGKSLCYQLPALLMEGVAIVISPLIALMKNQVDSMRTFSAESGVAHFLNSSLNKTAVQQVRADVLAGKTKLLYFAPESLTKEDNVAFLRKIKISFYAIDEAHCISEWGHDFRPEYRRIRPIINEIGSAPLIALTATATPKVQMDIQKNLGMSDAAVFKSSFNRPNLYYEIRPKHDVDREIIRFIKQNEGKSGIIYCLSRKKVEELTELLIANGIKARAYHAGMDAATRAGNQDDFLMERVDVIVATIAFGMGIDKPDVRFVVHYSICDSLESYYQEAGRAGRDGQRAYALLLAASDDNARAEQRFKKEFPPLDQIKDIYEQVCSYLQVGIGDGAGTACLFNLHDFCARQHLWSGTVVGALRLLQQNGYLTLTDAQENPARIMFAVHRDDLYKLRVERSDLDHFIRTLLRLYNGIFTEFRPIDEAEIATWSGYTADKVKELLKRLWQLRVIRYVPSNRSPILYFNQERLPRADLYIAPETYQRRQELLRERFSHMTAYAANDTECRSAVLERYFGSEETTACGICDLCLARRRAAKQDDGLPARILEQLAAGPAKARTLADAVAAPPERVAEAVRRLLDEGKIAADEAGNLRIIA
ncbi:MAG TPA: RecQ family ATP-dependent DNA helicase [Alistipes sp.]|nr:RecQ family ATP-dependent DNA helicase [Alistipes sp.]